MSNNNDIKGFLNFRFPLFSCEYVCNFSAAGALGALGSRYGNKGMKTGRTSHCTFHSLSVSIKPNQ